MKYINWFIVSIGLFIASMILFTICNLAKLTDVTWAWLYLSGWLLNFGGWFALIGIWVDR